MATLPLPGDAWPLDSPGESGAPAAVSIQGLCKAFPVRRPWRTLLRRPWRTETTRVLREVTCEIRRGEFFGVLGPNGAGKTTLFRVLATLVLPDAGTVAVEGYDVVRDAARARRVVAPVLTNERSLFWRISARENLRLFGVLHGLRGRELRGRLDQVLELLELAGTGDKLVGTYSSGMKQRLLLARALLSRPKVLLLDEPTRSLDPISARAFRRLLRGRVAVDLGCTVLLATHNNEEAFELCDRVGVLDAGRLLAVGSPSRLGSAVPGDRYRIRTAMPEHAALSGLADRGILRVVDRRAGGPGGWATVDVEIRGGEPEAARVLGHLVAMGLPVAGYERVAPSLADLIEVITRGRGATRSHV